MQEPRAQATAAPSEQRSWFRYHQRYGWVGLIATMVALGLGLVMWLGARLTDRAPATLLVLLHVLAGVVAVIALGMAASVAWTRPNRPSLAQIVSRSQQQILQHRLLAFASLLCGIGMLITGVAALLAWLLDAPAPILIYGHLITGIMLAPLVVVTFLIGLRPLRRNRFGH